MKALIIEEYPNFYLARKGNTDLTWEEELWAVGLKSAREVYDGLVMSDADLTLFILRFA